MRLNLSFCCLSECREWRVKKIRKTRARNEKWLFGLWNCVCVWVSECLKKYFSIAMKGFSDTSEDSLESIFYDDINILPTSLPSTLPLVFQKCHIYPPLISINHFLPVKKLEAYWHIASYRVDCGWYQAQLCYKIIIKEERLLNFPFNLKINKGENSFPLIFDDSIKLTTQFANTHTQKIKV